MILPHLGSHPLKGQGVGGGGEYLTLTIAMGLRTLNPPLSIDMQRNNKETGKADPYFNEKTEVFTICNS